MSSNKDCKFCDKKGLLWLPLRYSAVVADKPGDLGSLPAVGGKLGKGVTDLALTESRYGVRLLRPGYLYVLIERKGVKYWTAYQVLEDAFLYQFDPEQPPQVTPQFSCDRTVCGVNASMVAIPDAKEVKQIWSLFTPSAMTKDKLAEYKKNADSYAGKGKMQTFSPAGWVGGSMDQPHSLQAPELLKSVVEYVLYMLRDKAREHPLGQAMEKQLFMPSSAAYGGVPPNDKGEYYGRLGALYNSIKKNKYAAFALYDHIGVTQELNDFRNSALEGLESYLAATDQHGSTNQQRLQIHEAIEELRIGYTSGVVQSTQAFIDQHQQSSDQWFENRRRFAATLRSQGRTEDAEAVEKQVEESLVIRAANYKKAIEQSKAEGPARWKAKYASRLDEAEMKAFWDAINHRTRTAFDKVDKRVADHLKWFESDRLVNAFDVYDPKSQMAGFEFAIESAICSFGLSGCKVGEAKIDAWVEATVIDRKNLYMRGYYQNQKELLDAAKEANDAIKAEAGKVTEASAITGAMMLKATKSLVSAFKSTDSAFDEWVRNQGQKNFAQKWVNPSLLSKVSGQKYGVELILFHKVSDITRTVFRKGVGGKADVALVARLSGILYARLGSVAEKLRYDELMLKIDKSKLADGYKGRSAERNLELADRRVQPRAAESIKKELAPSLGDLVADAQEKNKTKLNLSQLVGNASPPTNNYHHVRIGVVLACIELIGLGEKMSHAEKSWKSALEIGGGAMAVGSVILDTFYAAAKSIREIAPYKKIDAIQKGADIVRGGFKLGAGVLGLGAGLCGATLDVMKIGKTEDKTLKQIYALRALSGFVSAGLTIAAALSYSGPLAAHMLKRYTQGQIRHWIWTKVAAGAARLAARVRLLVWVARFNWIGLALTAAEIGYLLLKDDDLQNWCEQSSFRKKRVTTWYGRTVDAEGFPNADKELEELMKASNAVGMGG